MANVKEDIAMIHDLHFASGKTHSALASIPKKHVDLIRNFVLDPEPSAESQRRVRRSVLLPEANRTRYGTTLKTLSALDFGLGPLVSKSSAVPFDDELDAFPAASPPGRRPHSDDPVESLPRFIEQACSTLWCIGIVEDRQLHIKLVCANEVVCWLRSLKY